MISLNSHIARVIRIAIVLLLTAVVAEHFSVSPTLAQDLDSSKHDNWHQWRGPNANGVASKGNPPAVWDDKTNIKWKIKIEGEGSSTPIIWGDNVYILSAIETERKPDKPPELSKGAKTKPPENVLQFLVWCFDRNTGEVKWKKVVRESAAHEGRHQTSTYAASSPMTDGKNLYVLFGSHGVYCLTMDGDVVWEKNLGVMRTRLGWGEAVSPVIHGDKLVVMWDQEDQSEIFVLNSKDGEVIWKKDREEPTTWATPLIVKANGKNQIITNGTEAVRSYELESGDLIWEAPGTTLNAIPCPIQNGNEVICMAGYRGTMAFAVDLDSQGTVTADSVGADEQIKWTFPKHTSYVSSPLLIDGRLYFTKRLEAILNCIDANTGEPVFELTRMPEMKRMYGSPVAASDRIYFTSREGTTLVIKNSDKFEIISTNPLSEEIDASPAIVGDQIFLRGKKNLYCIEKAEK